MTIFDRYTAGAVLLVGAISMLVALILGRRTSWSKRRIQWIAASPIPILATLLALAMTVRVMTMSKDACGIDACGMAMIAAFILMFLAGMAFILSAITALVGYWIAKR